MFAVAVLLTGYLWSRQLGLPNAVGEAVAVRVDAVSPLDGTLAAVPGKPLELFDVVQAGQVIVRLDDHAAVATLARMQAGLARLRIDLETAAIGMIDRQAALQQGDSREARALAIDIERLRLVIVEHEGLVETDRALLARLNEKYDAVKPLVDRGVEPRLTLVDIELQRDVVQKRIEGMTNALAEARAQKAACEGRLGKFSPVEVADLQKMLAPVREAIAAEETRLQDVRRQIESMEIRAPISGTVMAVFARPGQTVAAGATILTLASGDSQCIVSYVRENQQIHPAVGMGVAVHVRAIPRDSGWARVERIGPQVEPIPPHQLRDPRVPEWGLPVRITMPPGLKLRPGELVDVAFNRTLEDGVR